MKQLARSKVRCAQVVIACSGLVAFAACSSSTLPPYTSGGGGGVGGGGVGGGGSGSPDASSSDSSTNGDGATSDGSVSDGSLSDALTDGAISIPTDGDTSGGTFLIKATIDGTVHTFTSGTIQDFGDGQFDVEGVETGTSYSITLRGDGITEPATLDCTKDDVNPPPTATFDVVTPAGRFVSGVTEPDAGATCAFAFSAVEVTGGTYSGTFSGVAFLYGDGGVFVGGSKTTVTNGMFTITPM